jgi:hypothetical protein
MEPLSFTDSQLETIFSVASCVPVKLRDRYLKDIARRLPVDGNIEKAVSTVLAKFDKIERKATASRRNAEKQKAFRQRKKNGLLAHRVHIIPQVIEGLINLDRLTEAESHDPKLVDKQLSVLLNEWAQK